jgi:hypothetical protein
MSRSTLAEALVSPLTAGIEAGQDGCLAYATPEAAASDLDGRVRLAEPGCEPRAEHQVRGASAGSHALR